MTRRKPAAFVASLALLSVSCSAPSSGPGESAAPSSQASVAPAGPLGMASISGRVTFAGPIPRPARITLSSEPKCAAAHPDGIVRQAIRVQGGGLADAVVYVKGGLSGPFTAPAAPVVLDQQGCEYVPAVVAVQAGQPLLVRNSDDLAHNVHFRPVANPESNKGQPRKGIEQAVTFAKAELLFPVGCDIHPWMRAFVAVLPNPYFAITSSDGAFEIKGLPAGTYEIEAAHARLKTAATTVTVKDGETAQATVSFQ